MRDVFVHPQPAHPVKADSDHNIVVTTIGLGGRLTHNRAVWRDKPKQQPFSRQVLKILHNLQQRQGELPPSTTEAACEFTEDIFEAA